MPSSEENKRDRGIARDTSKLFIRAMLVRPGIFALCLLVIPITIVSAVVAPLLIATIIEDIVERNFAEATKWTWWLGGLLTVNIGLKAVWNYFTNIDGILGAKYLHRRAFRHMIDQDYDFFASQYTGALASHQQRFVTAFINYNHLVLIDLPLIATVIVGSIFVLAVKSPLLALITLVCVASITAVTVIAATLRLNQRRELSRQNGLLAGQLADSLGHAMTVKALANEERETKRLGGYIASWAGSQLRLWHTYIYGDAARTFLHVVTFVVILLVSIALYRDGQIGIATITLVQLYTIRLLDMTLQIAQLIKVNETAMSDAYQMMLILQTNSKVTDPAKPVRLPATGSAGVVLDGVNFTYGNRKSRGDVIRNFSLTIMPGEKVGIVGPSGAGKTTLTKLLLRFYDVKKGSISVGGMDVRKLSQQELRSHIAYVPQEPLLFYRSIRENIAYAADDVPDSRVDEAAEQAHVTQFSSELNEGLETMVGERGVKLSGGQRQRVAIARAMLRDAPVLVLDEATSALDSETESLIQDGLFRLMEDKTAIVIAHRLSTIRRMDRIVVVDKGRIVEEGTHGELLNKDGLYARLWGHQSGGFIGGA